MNFRFLELLGRLPLVLVLALLMLWFFGGNVFAYDPDPMPIVARAVTDDCDDMAGCSEVLAVSYRAPIGHTHTCASGHTWDHSANPGHTCQTCGLSQYVQDKSPRPVTVITRQRVRQSVSLVTTGRRAEFDPTGDPLPIVHRQTYPAYVVPTVQSYQNQSFESFSGGCANGQCSSGAIPQGNPADRLNIRARIREGGPVRKIVGRIFGGCGD